MNLLVEHVGFDFQLVELREHQLLRLFAARFFLPFPDDDPAQHLIFLHELGVSAELAPFSLAAASVPLASSSWERRSAIVLSLS